MVRASDSNASHKRVCVCVWVSACVRACVSVCVRVCVYAHECIHMRAHVHMIFLKAADQYL